MLLVKLETNKIIGDPIHGYIPLTQLEYNLIQLPSMMRLHHIHQTALAYLAFPGSVTTRFTHVIGASYVGNKIINQLFSTIEESDFKKLFPELPNPEFLIKAVRLACLFHDVGHGPYSHSAEDAMLKVTKKLNSSEVTEATKLFCPDGKGKPPIHEFFSYKLIKDGSIGAILKDEKDGKLLIDSVLELLIKNTDSKLYKNNPGFKLIRNVVSSQLDADRFDYMLRDGAMSGVKFGVVDIDRIIKNMAIVNPQGAYQLAIHERAIGNIEDMLDSRYKMYRWFYSHHTVVVTNELIKIAIDFMIEKDDIAKLFHWSSFEDGFSTDEHILNILRTLIKADERYLKVKGLIDRRYFPISLYKSTPEVGNLIGKVGQIAKKSEDFNQVKEFILSFFKDHAGAETIRQSLEQSSSDLKKCFIHHAPVRMKPYEPFKENDKIWLYRNSRDSLCEFMDESEYFKSVNSTWAKFHGLFIFYVIPGKTRSEMESYKDNVRETLTKKIAEAYASN